MEYKIERKKNFKIAGIIHKNCTEKSNFTEYWNEFYQIILKNKLQAIGDATAYGSCCCYQEKNGITFSYVTAFELTNEKLAKEYGLDIIEIPEAEYVVIKLEGKLPYCIKDGWKFAMNKLFNENGMKYKKADTPDFEVYFKNDKSNEYDKMELWIPIKTKN